MPDYANLQLKSSGLERVGPKSRATFNARVLNTGALANGRLGTSHHTSLSGQ